MTTVTSGLPSRSMLGAVAGELPCRDRASLEPTAQSPVYHSKAASNCYESLCRSRREVQHRTLKKP